MGEGTTGKNEYDGSSDGGMEGRRGGSRDGGEFSHRVIVAAKGLISEASIQHSWWICGRSVDEGQSRRY